MSFRLKPGGAIAMLSLGVFAVLPGCSDNNRESPVATQATDAQPAQAAAGSLARPAPAAPPNLSGSVSGLKGSITAFAVRETATSTIVEMAADTLFAFDRADLSPQAQDTLAKVADLIRRGGDGEIVIAGHTDSAGSDSYNEKLSRLRAEAVRDWLAAQNVASASRFRIDAAGETRPKVPNAHTDGRDSPEGRAQNRRVEVIIPKG